MNDHDPTPDDRDIAAEVAEDYFGDTLDADRIGELIADIATALAHVRAYGTRRVS